MNTTSTPPPDPPPQEASTTRATIVRYTTRPECAVDNGRLIEALFAELAEQTPEGLRYVSFQLDDGVSFVHVALHDGDRNPLPDLPAFRQFVSAIGDRCVEGPTPTDGTLLGSYRMGT